MRLIRTHHLRQQTGVLPRLGSEFAVSRRYADENREAVEELDNWVR